MGRTSPVCVLVVVVAAMMPYVAGLTVINVIPPTEGDEYMMDCGGSGPLQYFLLHQKGEALRPKYYETLRIEVFVNASVFFESIKIEHEGTHLCIRNVGTEQSQGYPTELRVRSKPPSDLWRDVYEAKFVTGFLAALTIAALFVLGCLVQKYRWRPKETDTDPIVSSSGGYINTAMTGDDFTKM